MVVLLFGKPVYCVMNVFGDWHEGKPLSMNQKELSNTTIERKGTKEG